jgi:hypothetical protein
MIVALVALFVAMGGSAYALVVTGKSIKNGTVTNKDLKDRSVIGNDVNENSIGGGAIKESSLSTVNASFLSFGGARQAVVNGGGQLVRGRDAQSARTSAGRYQVIFGGDVRGCAYFATVGDPSAGAPPQNSQVTVSSLGSNVNGVAVRTENGNGVEVDRPFHLIVSC